MKKKIAYIINHSAFFYSHIIDVALNARKNNYQIKLFCGKASSIKMDNFAKKKIKQKKISIIENRSESSSINILNEFIGLTEAIKSVKKYKPDIIHCASPKGIFFGGIISKILKIKSIVIFNSGMGFLFSNKSNFFFSIIKCIYIFILKKYIMKHKNKIIVVENKDDYFFLKKKYKLKLREIKLIKGSGVDLSKYYFIKKNNSKNVLLPARVIKEKGIEEFISASISLKKKYPKWNFIVAGALDYNKQSTLRLDKIKKLNKGNVVKFLGYVKNMRKVYTNCSIVCLPSYREGFSRTLQEAAAKGLPIVTTNVIGCKDAIIPKVTGLLCKPRNAYSLEKELSKLISDKAKREFFGFNARKLAENQFSLKNVLASNLNIYNFLIKNR